MNLQTSSFSQLAGFGSMNTGRSRSKLFNFARFRETDRPARSATLEMHFTRSESLSEMMTSGAWCNTTDKRQALSIPPRGPFSWLTTKSIRSTFEVNLDNANNSRRSASCRNSSSRRSLRSVMNMDTLSTSSTISRNLHQTLFNGSTEAYS